MAAHTDGDADGIVGINVTPLVDIMLVLLIIFMVASSYIVNPAIEVDLPQAASAGEALDTTLSLVLKADGALFLNGEAASRDVVAAQCKAASGRDPQTQAIIAADAGASHGQVVRLIDLVKLNGVRKFAISTALPAEQEG
jgi:biopolymer transport protein ExbD